MDNDDRPIGRVLTRREMLKLLASVSAAAVAASCAPRLPGAAGDAVTTPASGSALPTQAATGIAPTAPATVAASAASATAQPAAVSVLPSCVVRPQQTEGPYFVDERLNRADIRSDPNTGSVKEGALLALTFLVSRIGNTCEPLPGAIVDIWHCDAAGIYSDVNDASAGSTVGQGFLRGYQTTDANGLATFTTIYPGWYPGRTVHIHFKIRTEEGGAAYDFTSQLYFDDTLTDAVFTQAPYAARGPRNTRNERDGIYGNGGSRLLLNVVPSADGYAATIDIGLDMS